LPQGAPTSPALSNLVCREMDADIAEIAAAHGATYSRYADDLCLSLVDSSRAQALALKRAVAAILHKHSFTENKRKARITPPGARKVVTGLIVNGTVPTIPKEVRDRVRMHLYYCRIRGIPEHCKRIKFRSVVGFRNHLAGMIEYIRSIDERYGASFLKEFEELPWLDFDL
jgi:RNA-directed DNA polymerase